MKCPTCAGKGEINVRDMSIGGRLKLYREKAGYTLRDVANLTGFSNPAISQIETGRIQNPRFDMVMRLCQVYEITPEDLL